MANTAEVSRCLLFSETMSYYVVQLAWNSWQSSCLNILSVRITSINHHFGPYLVSAVSRLAWPITNCGARSWPMQIPAERERLFSRLQSHQLFDSLPGQGLKSPEGRATACDSFLKADRLTGGSHWELQNQHWEKQKMNSTNVSIKTQSHKSCQEWATVS